MLQELYQHMEWADATTWRAVLSQKEAAADVTLHKRLHHIHLVQQAFLKIWTQQSPDFQPAKEFENLPAILKWALAYYRDLPSFVDGISEADLQSIVEIPWSKQVAERLGKAPENTKLQETMTQVAFHTAHHRGQITAQLRQLGGEPPLIDYIAWVWLGRPKPEWPTAP